MKRIFAVAIILVIILAPGAVASADYGIVVTGHPSVEGEYTACLAVGNQTTELNGWAVFCHFHSDIDNANTNWAFFHVL